MNLEMEESSNDAQAACGFSWSASKRTPFFHTSKVMAAILRGQSETCHRWFHAFGNQRRVELLERSGYCGGPDGGAFEDVFQIVIMILVESANGQDLLGTLELAMHHTIFKDK
jgi:hypothetical protein